VNNIHLDEFLDRILLDVAGERHCLFRKIDIYDNKHTVTVKHKQHLARFDLKIRQGEYYSLVEKR
jgi:hypothetical protein